MLARPVDRWAGAVHDRVDARDGDSAADDTVGDVGVGTFDARGEAAPAVPAAPHPCQVRPSQVIRPSDSNGVLPGLAPDRRPGDG